MTALELADIRYQARLALASGDYVRKQMAQTVLNLCDHIAASQRGVAPPDRLAGKPGAHLCEVLGDRPAEYLLTYERPDGSRYTKEVCQPVAMNATSHKQAQDNMPVKLLVDRLINSEALPSIHRANDAIPPAKTEDGFECWGFI